MIEVVECEAARRGNIWIAHLTQHGVFGCGRTLRATRRSVEEGLALLGIAADVELTPTSPELVTLRDAEAQYARALQAAVERLSRQGATLGDTSKATRLSVKRVKVLRGVAPAVAGNEPHPQECSGAGHLARQEVTHA
ncbi:hypothetical protein ABT160_04540 [Streptomyces sp. NPDC001941]|uniref:hypothetical protein n=1 Tax=Streptomyces sp. NPDC001941 TaxID=3154659 RepID=UPI00332F7B90